MIIGSDNMKDTLIILLYSLIPISIFTVSHIVFRLIGFSFKAHKYGYKTKGTIIGYYAESTSDVTNICWYPVVKIDDNGNEALVKSKLLLSLPVYKINEIVNIEYYNEGMPEIVTKKIYKHILTTGMEEVDIDKNSEINILSLKNDLTYILEMVAIIAIFIAIIIIRST